MILDVTLLDGGRRLLLDDREQALDTHLEAQSRGNGKIRDTSARRRRPGQSIPETRDGPEELKNEEGVWLQAFGDVTTPKKNKKKKTQFTTKQL